MSIVTADMAVSLDLVGSGRDQSHEHPFGPRVGERLHTWMFEHGDESAEEVAAITDAGAFVMGRNMFGPDRGDWDLGWTGGGARSRRTTHPSSCSRTASASRCRWPAAPRSTS